MVVQRGFKVDTNNLNKNAEETEYEMIRLEHFANRYREHQKSIVFAIKRLATIRTQIDVLLDSNNTLSPKDFDFLLDIAGLVVAARRSLSYTYPFRYYLYGENKQRYFDFIQSDLEQSLERLNGKNEEDWTEYLDIDQVSKKPIMGEKFFKYKQEIITLREAAERHLNSAVADIEAGLPDVAVEKTTKRRDVLFDEIAEKADWRCRTCMT